MKLLIILGIYILGFMLSYYTGRAIWKRKFSQWGWDDIFGIMKLSLFSWITFIMLILLEGDLLFPPIKRKPPKWLILIPLLTLTACTDSGEMGRMKQPTYADTVAQCHKEFEAISMRALPTWSMCNRQYYAKQDLNISYRMGEISYTKYKREWLYHDSLHKVYSDSFDFVDRRMDSLYAIMYPVDTNKLK